MDVCHSIVESLESVGVEAFFSGSGQGPGGIMFALQDAKKLKTIIAKNEQGASFMACGYAYFSDKLGVCNAQGGPGAFNMLSGAAVAMSASIPMLTLSSYTPVKWRGKGDLGEATGHYRTPDQHAMFAATTKKAYIMERPEDTSDVLEEAINLAYEGRRGAVHIDIPTDVMGAEVPNHREITLTIKPVPPMAKDVRLFADVLARAIEDRKKIIIHAGFGVVRSHAEAEVAAFAERFQIPVVHTMDAKGVIREDHPLSLGMGGVSADPGAFQAYREAEIVLAIGNSFAKWQCWRFQDDLFDDKTLLHINIDRPEINKVFKADYAMVADVKLGMIELAKAMEERVGAVPRVTPVIDKYYHHVIDYQGGAVHPGQLCQAMSRLLPERAIVLGDAGAHMIWLADFMQFTGGQKYKNPGAFGPMASHTNAAVGVQLAHPDRRVIIGSGDGCYLMSGFELMVAVEHKLPIIWVILNNSEFNIIKMFHLTIFKKEAFNQYPTPDFAEYAKVCGANGFRVGQLEDFAPAFEAALKSNMPSVIDVIVDKDAIMPYEFYHE